MINSTFDSLVAQFPTSNPQPSGGFAEYKNSFCSQKCWNDEIARTLFT